jgi:hypothetical protein
MLDVREDDGMIGSETEQANRSLPQNMMMMMMTMTMMTMINTQPHITLIYLKSKKLETPSDL